MEQNLTSLNIGCRRFVHALFVYGHYAVAIVAKSMEAIGLFRLMTTSTIRGDGKFLSIVDKWKSALLGC
jgi:hypothetical protein